MYKLNRDMATELIKELILPNRQHRYESRNNPDFAVPIVKSVHKSLESLSYSGPKVWELLPLEVKEIETFLQFKANIKKWNPRTVLDVFFYQDFLSQTLTIHKTAEDHLFFHFHQLTNIEGLICNFACETTITNF